MKVRKFLRLALCSVSALVSLQAIADTTAANAEQSPWQVRVRAIDVVPEASSSTITGLGGEVTDISSQIVPELDISYFFSKHVSAELILATSKSNVTATGTAIGNVDLGSVWVLPPTLTLQYHFLPEKMINPYVGAGLNYTTFYNVDSGPVADSIDYSNSFGPALEIGADIMIDENWMINLDVKQIFMQTNATVNVGADSYTTTVDINPVVYGVGIGYRFS